MSVGLVPVPLDSTGKIYDKNAKADRARGGLISVLKNHPIRGVTWNLFTLTFHSQTGEMCLADDRGQIYLLRFNENIYYSLRLASSPILCLEFVHSRPSELLVGYANGFTISIDTASNEIKSSFYAKGSDPICLIRCSANRPFAVMLSLSGRLSLWDLGQLTTVRRMEIPEPIVDLFFLRSGSHIAITFQTLGVIVYSLSDSMTVESRCTTPTT
jgi:WD40 repeat protein